MRQSPIGWASAVALLLIVGQASAADSSLGVGLGYVKAKSVEETLWFSTDFRFHVGRNFALAPEFSYWKKSATSLGVSASFEDLQFGVNALGVLSLGRSLEVFGGGGGGLHHITGNLAVRNVSTFSDSSTKPGLDVLGGIDIKAGEGLSFFLAARYDWVLDLSGEDPQRLDQGKFFGGFRVRF